MYLTEERRKKTGAFYTPEIWAKKAAEYIEKVIPYPGSRWCDGAFVFYDPAAGEGALLEAVDDIYGGAIVSGTTLEDEDVNILKDKGYFHVKALDFLEKDSIKHLPPIVYHASKTNRLVVVTNPPFVKIGAQDYISMKNLYGTNDATALFLYRIFNELNPVIVCSFHKLDILQAPTMSNVRKDLLLRERIISCFVSPSTSWGLKGKFPISFCIYSGS